MDEATLAEAIGADCICRDSQELDRFANDVSFANRTRPAMVIRPRAAIDVQRIVQFANATGTPLVPVSSGPPHFRGDTVPSTGGAAIVDLRGLKRVVLVDRPRRVAICEPGVTFGQLIPEAKRQGLRLNMPLLPRASKSVVASILEREPVVMPKYQWDISDPLACAGLYFGTGDEFRTGQAAGPGTLEEQWQVGAAQKAPYGPGTASWHRLIQGAQGTMGIVTWMSMRCELLPALEEPFVVAGAQLEDLLELAHWLIRLRIVNECLLLNRTNLATIFAGNSPAAAAECKAALAPWILFYTVAGYQYFPDQRVESQLCDIAELTQRLAVEARRAVGGVSAHDILRTVQQPSSEPYWKLRPRGACQDVFYLTVREKLVTQIAAMSDLAAGSGYSPSELGIYIQPTAQGTSYHCEFNLFYDPASRRERVQVEALAHAAVQSLMARGAFFSRPYGGNAASIANRDAATVSVLRTLKKVFDPNNVMNPGKVCF